MILDIPTEISPAYVSRVRFSSRRTESFVIFEAEQDESMTEDRLTEWWLVSLRSEVDTESRSSKSMGKILGFDCDG